MAADLEMPANRILTSGGVSPIGRLDRPFRFLLSLFLLRAFTRSFCWRFSLGHAVSISSRSGRAPVLAGQYSCAWRTPR